MLIESLLSALRHGLTYGGGFLTSAGLATGGEVETASAAVVTLAGFAWSVYRKFKNKPRLV